MNYRLLLLSLVWLAGLTVTLPSHAKDYAIEVIIFVNQEGLQQTAEQFSADHIIPVSNNGIQLNAADNDTPWQPLPAEEYILKSVASRLQQSGQYQVIKHIAWRQPMADKNDALPIQIQAGRDFTASFPERAYRQVEFSDTGAINASKSSDKIYELEGTINVVITRYIHVYSDMVYRLPRTNPSVADDAMHRQQVLVDYSVNSHRRMRSGELHYIDHPLVGILVEATPIEDN